MLFEAPARFSRPLFGAPENAEAAHQQGLDQFSRRFPARYRFPRKCQPMIACGYDAKSERGDAQNHQIVQRSMMSRRETLYRLDGKVRATAKTRDHAESCSSGVAAEHLAGGASAEGRGCCVGRVVVPHEFGCGIITDQNGRCTRYR